MSRWYRAYEGTVTDAKLGEVALIAECSRSVAIAAWHCILESAASVNDGGRFDTTPRRVAVILGEKPAIIEAVMAELTALGMIADGAICAWQKRQYESDSSTERSRKHRQQKRNADATLQSVAATPEQRDATPPDTETDTDTPLKPPRKRGGGDTLIPQNWQAPAVSELTPEAIKCAEQWPPGAYARHAEEFVNYWRTARKKRCDWRLTWANRVIALHEQVMRDSRRNGGAITAQSSELYAEIERKYGQAGRA